MTSNKEAALINNRCRKNRESLVAQKERFMGLGYTELQWCKFFNQVFDKTIKEGLKPELALSMFIDRIEESIRGDMS